MITSRACTAGGKRHVMSAVRSKNAAVFAPVHGKRQAAAFAPDPWVAVVELVGLALLELARVRVAQLPSRQPLERSEAQLIERFELQAAAPAPPRAAAQHVRQLAVPLKRACQYLRRRLSHLRPRPHELTQRRRVPQALDRQARVASADALPPRRSGSVCTGCAVTRRSWGRGSAAVLSRDQQRELAREEVDRVQQRHHVAHHRVLPPAARSDELAPGVDRLHVPQPAAVGVVLRLEAARLFVRDGLWRPSTAGSVRAERCCNPEAESRRSVTTPPWPHAMSGAVGSPHAVVTHTLGVAPLAVVTHTLCSGVESPRWHRATKSEYALAGSAP
eukprot:5981315-Prymnesium_polylepis.2